MNDVGTYYKQVNINVNIVEVNNTKRNRIDIYCYLKIHLNVNDFNENWLMKL